MRLPFIPKGEAFFELFEQSAANLVSTAKLFQELVQNWEGIEDKVRGITDFEHEGDTITHRIIANLHRTFFTPLDREDIALLAHAMSPTVADYMFAGHRSVEQGHQRMLEHIGLRPILDLGMRLGEGTGAALAMHIIEAGVRVFREVLTFEQAGVSKEAT